MPTISPSSQTSKPGTLGHEPFREWVRDPFLLYYLVLVGLALYLANLTLHLANLG